jgi:predicted secreted protein
MAFTHGSVAVFTLHDGSNAVDVSDAVQSVSFERNRDTAEVTGLGDTDKEYIGGLRDATLSLDGTADSTLVDNLQTSFEQDAPVAWTYDPEGTASGTPHFNGDCIVTSISQSSSVDDANKVSVEIQTTGGVTRGSNGA